MRGKILHLEASLGWGGQEIRILKEAQKMRERGYKIFFAISKEGILAKYARQKGFKVYELNFKKACWPITFFRLLRIIKINEIDIVNTHSSLDAWIGGLVAKMLKIPVIRTRHLSTPIREGINSIILYKKLVDFIVTTCSKVVPIICRQAKQDFQWCKSIPTGVDTKALKVSEKEALNFRKKIKVREDDFLVGTMCFIRKWKGIEDFLEAAFLLRGKMDIKWVIIGGGFDSAVRKKARELSLTNVSFTGHLENPFSALAALDVFVLLSTAHEGVSQASLQAAFLQKPLITTSTGGLSEVCVDGVTGLQVPPFSPKRVVEAVVKLRKDVKLRREMGRRAKILVEEKFTLDKMVDQMEEIYKILLK